MSPPDGVSGVGDLAERYGAPAPWRRRLVLGGSTAVVLAFAGWLAWTTLYHAEPQAQSQLVSFRVEGQYAATAVVAVDLADDAVRAQCRLRAFAEDHAVVGELVFEPDPTAGPRYRQQVRTERRASAVESLGCTTPDQPRPR